MRPLEREATIYPEQIVSAIVQDDILKDEQLLVDTITEIQLKASERAIEAQTALNESLARVENVRDFVSSPEHILGPMGTKHGEIAEHIEVEIGNAKRIMSGLDPNRTFDGVGRTAPEDYLIDGIQVQSKFINGANKNLDEILDHLSTYPDFAKNGGYYHIPKDYYETIRKILSGQTEGINSRTVRKCLEAVETIEKVTGKKFSELVFPGISTYKEVQLGAVDKTLDGYEQEFKEQHAQKKGDPNYEADVDYTDGIKLHANVWSNIMHQKDNGFLGISTVNTFVNDKPICRRHNVCGVVASELAKRLLEADDPMKLAKSGIVITNEEVDKLHERNQKLEAKYGYFPLMVIQKNGGRK